MNAVGGRTAGRPGPLVALPSVEPQHFTGALSLAANSVSIVTTNGPGGRAGLTVSSMCSVCAEPPLVLACVNAENEFNARVDINDAFAINLLAVRHAELSNRFAGLDSDAEDDRFAVGDWTTGATGAPLLADAVVALDCVLESASRHGTHRLHIGRVVEVRARDDRPLIYARRAYASLEHTGPG